MFIYLFFPSSSPNETTNATLHWAIMSLYILFNLTSSLPLSSSLGSLHNCLLCKYLVTSFFSLLRSNDYWINKLNTENMVKCNFLELVSELYVFVHSVVLTDLRLGCLSSWWSRWRPVVQHQTKLCYEYWRKLSSRESRFWELEPLAWSIR